MRGHFGKPAEVAGTSREFGAGVYRVSHCGHPTALWPWAVAAPNGALLVSWNGRAFPTKAAALAAVGLLLSGKFVARRLYGESQWRLGLVARAGGGMDGPGSWQLCQETAGRS